MGVTSSNKEINQSRIACDGTLKITLSLSAAPDITSNPTDIVLILDRSGSMAGDPLANMKAGAKTFIDIIEEATDGVTNGQIGSGSRIGIVSFATTATADTQLITSVDTLKEAVNNLAAEGATNHADAFQKATELFDPMSANAKVMVMFTDGKTTAGELPGPVAAAARASGIIIYCIGLVGADGISVATLNDWATDPDASHVAVTPDDADLEELFRELAANISKTGATNIVIDEAVHPDFEIQSVLPPTKGTAMMIDKHTLQWKMDELGVSANEGATLEFFVKHTGKDGGEKHVNEAISYSDTEGNVVLFPDPVVTVDCGEVIRPEPVTLTVEGCEDSIVLDAGDVALQSLGRILQLNVTVKHVCPDKHVALAVILTETGKDGIEYPRGMKTMTLPAHKGSSCRDLLVQCISFVLPEDLSQTGSTTSLCQPRSFKARFLAHYIDTDFLCCDKVIQL